jgi:hypothetical protein
MVALLSVLALVVFVSVVSAETQPIDKGKGTTGASAEIKKDLSDRGSMGARTETMTGELSKGTERPMRAPELSEGGLDMKHLIVPDRGDFENARESDMLSSVSF